jgi:hypothetical protein
MIPIGSGNSYTMVIVEILEISEGICPVNALLSNKLPQQKTKASEGHHSDCEMIIKILEITAEPLQML